MNYLKNPLEIEKRSFEIIGEKLGDKGFSQYEERIVKRVIHTTCDFEYADILKFSENAIEKGLLAIKEGYNVVTDTKMAQSGINKTMLSNFGGDAFCFISDEKVIEKAKKEGTTRAMAAVDLAIENPKNKIFVFGNAPTAVFRLIENILEKGIEPKLIIGVPVGFVNVCECKNEIKKLNIPYIITDGGKGGSNVAAAIVNALLYILRDNI